MATDRFSLPFLATGQAQKEITHNEALTLIDMLLHAQAASASVSIPPSSPALGECWVVAVGGTGAWGGHDDEIACMTSGGWRFINPRKGTRIAIADAGQTLIYDGTGWIADPVRADGFYVSDVRVVAVRQAAIAEPSGGGVIDIEARTAIGEILGILRSHGLIEAA